MYYPYFRGKQYELIALRESANIIAKSSFVPIIEPVRESLGGIRKTLTCLTDAGAEAVLVVNPACGELRDSSKTIVDFLEKFYSTNTSVSVGILLTSKTTVKTASFLVRRFDTLKKTLIHAGFTDPRALLDNLGKESESLGNVFLEEHTNILYRKHFNAIPRILVNDGFVRRKNADYPPLDAFSDLHITYPEQNMGGYGDFLTVGDNYNEGGGPAYAVAIHLTFIDPNQDNAMFIYHFISDTNDTPTDPAGKFAQALKKLIIKLDSDNCYLSNTSAIQEFRNLYHQSHFPGLGYVKKLSIKHHLETLSEYHEVHRSA